jgi:hypothetical protein
MIMMASILGLARTSRREGPRCPAAGDATDSRTTLNAFDLESTDEQP